MYRVMEINSGWCFLRVIWRLPRPPVSRLLDSFPTLPVADGIPDFHLVVEALPLVLVFGDGLVPAGRTLRNSTTPADAESWASSSRRADCCLCGHHHGFYRRDLYESRAALVLFFALERPGSHPGAEHPVAGAPLFPRPGLNYGRALIVGGGRTGELVAHTIADNSWTGLEAVGLVDKPGRREQNCCRKWEQSTRSPAFAAQHKIDHVFVALPLSRYGDCHRSTRHCPTSAWRCSLCPIVPGFTGIKPQLIEIDGVPFVTLRQDPHRGWPCLAKRAMDVFLGTAA